MIPLVSMASVSLIEKASFTTEIRGVNPGEISEVITVQLQNSRGEAEKLDETADIAFDSSSESGEFLNSSGNPVTTTMAKNTASRSFYYRDQSEGEHVLTITITTRDTQTKFTASQKIKIGESTDVGNDDEDDNTNDNDEDTEGNDISSSNADSHSRAVPLSKFSSKTDLKVGAGRERTVLVNTPIVFEAETNKGNNFVKAPIDFNWSFGDGSGKYGRSVTHTYYFPGEYNVVLNASYRRENSVSRTKVKVIDPSISVVNFIPGSKGYVEIKNDSLSEVNINDWKLVSGKEEYIFADDTIINPKSTIRIPNMVSYLDIDNKVALVYPNEEIHMAYSSKPTTMAIATTTPVINIPIVYKKPVVKSGIQSYKPPTVKRKIETTSATNTLPTSTSVKISDKVENIPDQVAGSAGFFGNLMNTIKSIFFVH